MATIDEITELRLLTDIPSTAPPYTDLYLSNLIDEHGMESASAILWRQKAARYAGLVDTVESGSSRKLSQLRDAALKMAEGSKEPSGVGPPFTWPIKRL